jgi:hypothetical protein
VDGAVILENNNVGVGDDRRTVTVGAEGGGLGGGAKGQAGDDGKGEELHVDKRRTGVDRVERTVVL